jgi:hypothetical protein
MGKMTLAEFSMLITIDNDIQHLALRQMFIILSWQKNDLFNSLFY